MTRAKPIVLIGLAGILWFAALAQAAYDLWAACIVFLAVTLLVTVFAFWNWRSPRTFKLPLAPFIGAALAGAWISLTHSYDIDTTLLEAWGWFFASCVFYFLLNTADRLEDLDFFLQNTALVLLPLALLCVWQRMTGHPDLWGQWEIHATLINSHVLAGFVLYWFFWLWPQALERRPLPRLLLLSCIVILALARSSLSFICLFIGFLHYYWHPLRAWAVKHQKVGYVAFTLAVVVIGLAVAWKLHIHQGPYKGTSRMYYWLAALKIWAHEPWTGVGLGGFATAYPYVRDGRVQATLFTHSFALQWLVETGFMGMLTLLALVLAFLKSRPRSSPHMTTLITVLLFSLFSINLEYLLNKMLLLVTLAAALHSQEIPRFRIKPLWIGVFSLSLWLMSPYYLRMFQGGQFYLNGVVQEADRRTDLAAASYRTSVAIDPYLADAHAALARLAWQQFQKEKSPSARNEAVRHMSNALRAKKDKQFLLELHTYSAAHTSS